MKKLAKAALLAAATAFLLAGFPACSSDDDDDVYITNPDDSDADKDSEGDKTEDEGDQGDKDDESEGDKSDEEGDGEEEGSGEEDGDGEGEDDKEDDSDDDNKEDDSDDNEPVIVSAIFTMAKNVGDGNPFGNLTSETDVTDIAVTADDGGNGASLTFSGKIKTENNAINVSKATKISMANLESARGCFTLTLTGSARVKVHYKASGDVSEERFVVIADSDDTKITGVSPADKGEHDLETDEALEAGIYKIYVNGCKIYSVTAVSE